MSLIERPDKTPIKLVLPALLVFMIIGIIGMGHHELWLDEAQHFLIARDSESLGVLSHNMRYDGHAQLWNYLLFFITHYISSDPMAMQVFHLLIIGAAAYVFLRHAPFPFWIRLAILFGYYFIYEYSLISRNYALGILFLFLICALSERREKNLLLISVVAFLMCNTHLFFLFAAIGIFMGFAYDYYQQKRFPMGMIAFTFLLALATGITLYQVAQIPSDNTYLHPGYGTLTAKALAHPFYSIARGFLPVQDFSRSFAWNSYLYEQFPAILKVVTALVLFLLPVLVVKSSKPALIFYLAGMGLLMAFLFKTQMVGNRHFGMFFIFFLSALWLAHSLSPGLVLVPAGPLQNMASWSAVVVLLAGLVAGAIAFIKDLQQPFSSEKEAVRFLQNDHSIKNLVVDGYRSGPALSAYWGKPLYYLDIDGQGSYCFWKTSYFPKNRPPIREELIQSSYVHSLDEFILISNRDVTAAELNEGNAEFEFSALASFTRGIIKPDYYLFKANRKNEGNRQTSVRE